MADFYQIPLDMPKGTPEYLRWERLNFALRQIFDRIGNQDGKQAPMSYKNELDMGGYPVRDGPIMTSALDTDYVTKSYFKTAEFGKMVVTLLASTGKTPLPITGSTGTPATGGGGGTSDHAALLNLAYAVSGHTGFVPSARTISTTAPLTGGGDLSANRTIAIPAATGAVDGYLTAADWTTFNGKLSGTLANLTEVTSSVLTITGGTGAVIGAGTTIEVKQASGAQAGYLSAADWTTFNGKLSGTLANLTEVTSSVLTITGGTNAVIGTGTTIQVAQASGAQAGYLSAADWTTFNGKQNALSLGNLTEATSSVLTITGGTGAVVGNVTIQVTVASSGVSGYLSGADWNTFNGKVGGSGTAGNIPKWATTSTLGDSIIKEASSKIGIGTTGAPAYKLEVEGQVHLIDGAFLPAVQTLTFANPIVGDASLGNQFRVTLTASGYVLGPLTGLVDGQRIVIELIQDATGGRTYTLDTQFLSGDDTPPIVAGGTANKRDLLGAYYNSALGKLMITGFQRNY